MPARQPTYRSQRSYRAVGGWLLTLLGPLLCLVLATSLHGQDAPDSPQDQILGLWLVDEKEAVIEIRGCEEGICGRIVWIKDPLDEDGQLRLDKNNPDKSLREREVLGIDILTAAGRGQQDDDAKRKGRVYDPKNGKTYKCKIEIEEDGRLKLRGYVVIPLFGRTTRWTRVAELPHSGKTISTAE